MTENPDEATTTAADDENELTERPDVLQAMAVFSSDGQADDASGNDAGLAMNDQEASEADRMPHGPN